VDPHSNQIKKKLKNVHFFKKKMLTDVEVKHYVEVLKPYPIDEWGSPNWLLQQLKIEHLNVIAHIQASKNQFEKVVDLIKDEDKFEVLVHELISSDMCLTNIYNKIKPKLPRESFARQFIVERSMFTCLNFLELVVFKPESLTTDGLIPLISFCASKLAQLVSMDLGDVDPENQQDPNMAKFQTCFASLSIIWSLACATSDDSFSLSVTKKLVNESDLVPTLCELIVKQPWRTVRKGKVVKWDDQGLKTLSPAEAMRVCKPEAHAWTALQQLLEPRCLELTDWNDARREALLGVDSVLTEVLIDQLPPLQSLKRALQYLRVNQPPPPKFQPIIEQIPPMIEEFDKPYDWDKLRDNALNRYFKLPPQMQQKELMAVSEFLNVFQEVA
jgi:hypothetical protein